MKSLFNDNSGKPSSKRINGTALLWVVVVAFLADGISVYSINEAIATSLIFAAAALLGIGTFEKKNN
jgi:hypothetical protein